MKRIRDFGHSLQFKIWVSFFVFSVVILGIIWVFQVFMLEANFADYKMKRIERIGDSIVETYGTDDFYNKIDSVLLEEGINIMVFSINYTFGNQIRIIPRYPFDIPSGGASSDSNLPYGNYRLSVEQLYRKMLVTSSNRVVYVDEVEGNKTVFYGYYFKDSGLYLFSASTIEPIGTSIELLSSQLLLISFATIILGFWLSWIIAHTLSMPITKITDSAILLGKGKYDIDFSAKGYSEIEKLSSTLTYVCDELGKTSQLRENIIANISHDLRTPLTLIKAYAEMIHDISGDDKEKRDQHTQVIIDEATRLTNLVNDILDLSKIQAGTSIEKEILSLSDLVENVIDRFGIFQETENYYIEADIEDGINISADYLQIEQVVYNLISNAINYTGDDHSIMISLKRNNGYITFSVSDTGVGIAPENLKQIWERYYRTEDAHRRAHVGTGLGLSIVKSILELHGFEYGVNSIINKGSTFWFSIKE